MSLELSLKARKKLVSFPRARDSQKSGDAWVCLIIANRLAEIYMGGAALHPGLGFSFCNKRVHQLELLPKR
eukprot:5915644-Amphidinium_carterae.1